MRNTNWLKKGLVFGIIFLFIGTSVIPITAQNAEKSLPSSRGNWLYVGGDDPGNYITIQDAINHASTGDTVFVYHDSSPYLENLMVNKSINLIGEEPTTTIIDGNYLGRTINLSADGVRISGFTIQHGALGSEDGGLYMNSNNSLISHVIITNNSMSGLYLVRSSNNQILDCEFSHNYYSINIWGYSSDNVISQCSFHDRGSVIIWYYSPHTMITSCDFNGSGGVSISDENSVVTDCRFLNNDMGLTLTGGFNTVTDCSASHNRIGFTSFGEGNHFIRCIADKNHDCGMYSWGNSYSIFENCTIRNTTETGVFLWHVTYNMVKDCEITNSGESGVDIELDGWNTVTTNNIRNNTYGVLLVDTQQNNITNNNIMNSKEKDGFFLSYSKSNSINTWNENYWGRPRLLPKLIFGKKVSSEQLFPRWINIDWHPAKEPYDIPGMS
jgi:parallel beta-helix repeat protein